MLYFFDEINQNQSSVVISLILKRIYLFLNLMIRTLFVTVFLQYFNFNESLLVKI